MNNKLLILSAILLGSTVGNNAFTQTNKFQPSLSPIFNIPQPKPNIHMILDDSASMRNEDIFMPEHAYGFGLPVCDVSGIDRSLWREDRLRLNEYDPFIDGNRYVPWDNDKAIGGLINGKKKPPRINDCKKVARTEALDHSFKESMSKYKESAYLGVSFLWQVNDDVESILDKGYGLIKLPIDDYSQLSEERFEKEVINPVSNLIKKSPGDTPLYPAVYEALKMFRGQPVTAFGVNHKFTQFPRVGESKKEFEGKEYYEYVMHQTPLRYRCQENHLIVMTDGEPNDYKVWGIGLKDGLVTHPTTSRDLYINGVNQSTFTDEITGKKIGELTSQLDLRNAFKPININGKWSIKTKDDAGKDWNDTFSTPMPLVTHTVSLFVDPLAQLYLDMTKPTNGLNLGFAEGEGDAEDLMHAFDAIFASIIKNSSSTLSVVDRNTSNVLEGRPEIVNGVVDMSTVGAIRYDTTYNFREKFGTIRAIAPYISGYSAPSDSLVKEPIISVLELWNTDKTIHSDKGRYLTFIEHSDIGLKFNYLTDKDVENRFDYVYNQNHKKSRFADFKFINWLTTFGKPPRQKSLRTRLKPLGSVTNSDVVLANKDELYINIASDKMSETLGEELLEFLKYKAKNQPANLVIVADNDGFINFINAQRGLTGNLKAGERDTAYFPQLLTYRLNEIAKSDQIARLVLEGKTNLVDAKVYQPGVGSIYATIGITGMGAGGKGLVGYRVYAATESDVDSSRKQNATESDPINKVIPLFEITNEGVEGLRTKGFENLGYTYSGFEFFNRIESGIGQAVAVFGNGFGVDKSILYFIDAYTGKKLHEIVLNNNGGGASKPSIIVKKSADDKGQVLDRIYVGDYSGNMYRIDFKDKDFTSNNKTDVTLLYEATTQPGNYGQAAIFVRPLVTYNSYTGEYNISFGTGIAESKTLDRGKNSLVEHSIYSLIDRNLKTKSSTATAAELKNRSITLYPILMPENLKTGEVKYKSNNNVDYLVEQMHELNITKPVGDGNSGWKSHLIADGYESGERTIQDPKYDFQKNAVVFSTLGIHERSGGYEIDGIYDPCLSDAAFGKILSMDIKTGNATSAQGSISNIGSTNTAYGGVTGTGIGKSPEDNSSTNLDLISPNLKDELIDILSNDESSYVKIKNGISVQCKGDINAEVICKENRPEARKLEKGRINFQKIKGR